MTRFLKPLLLILGLLLFTWALRKVKLSQGGFHFAGNGGSSGFGCVFRAENSRTGLDCFGVVAGLGNVFQAIQGSTGTEGMSLRSNKTKPLIT